MMTGSRHDIDQAYAVTSQPEKLHGLFRLLKMGPLFRPFLRYCAIGNMETCRL
jgi:hypothetical protein